MPYRKPFIGSTEYGKTAAGYLQEIYHMLGNPDSAYYYSRLESQLRDSAFSQEKFTGLQSLAFAEQLRMRDEDLKKQKLRTAQAGDPIPH